MTIALRATGTNSTLIADALVPAIPTGTVAGDMMVLLTGGKQTTDAAVTATAGWTSLGLVSPTFIAAGVDIGSMKVGAWYREFVSGDTTPTVTFTNSNVATAVVHSFSKTASAWDIPTWAGGDHATSTTAHSVAGLVISVATGDMAITFSAFRTDAATPLAAVMGLTTPGITYAAGTKIPATDVESTLAGDMGTTGSYRLADSGTSSGNSTISGTLLAASTGSSEMVVLSEASGAAATSLVPPRIRAHSGLIIQGSRV